MNQVLIPKVDAATPQIARATDAKRVDIGGGMTRPPEQDDTPEFGAVFLAGEDAKTPHAAPQIKIPVDTNAPAAEASDAPVDTKPAGKPSEIMVEQDVPKAGTTPQSSEPGVTIEKTTQSVVDQPKAARQPHHTGAEQNTGAVQTSDVETAPAMAKPATTASDGPVQNPSPEPVQAVEHVPPQQVKHDKAIPPAAETQKEVRRATPSPAVHRHILESVMAVPAQTPDVPRMTSQKVIVPHAMPEAAMPPTRRVAPVVHTEAGIRPPAAAQSPVAIPNMADIPSRDAPEAAAMTPERVSATPRDGTTAAAEMMPRTTATTPAKHTVTQTMFLASFDGARPLGTDTAIRLHADALEVVPWDLRAAQTSAVTTGPVMLTQRADLPPHVAQQLAVALQKAPDKPVEIALNPPELGRVRMVMNASDTGVVVQVLTERSDTLDLMRRNIDELGRALSDLGYEDISFSFGQGDTGDAQADADDTSPDMLTLDMDDVPAPAGARTAHTPALAIAPDSIDIRL
ncbi:flagellar hook-length control protein FliK [uncultured Tateyamaria sp.]|uniref:flagellar hook-length control protein FliK n=1 Tax=Tateyamaria sp. 1078 TaxID=3417464 RepID=UPI0026147965|nr:flagellar hook-length control protein FliK [uncultured Tateyamaria sp.]